MNETRKLLKWARVYEAKLANEKPDLVALKRAVKGTIEEIWKTHPYVMDGLVYVSHIALGPDNAVSFTLNLDKKKRELADKNKQKRDDLINLAVKASLKQQFKQNFDLGFEEVFV